VTRPDGGLLVRATGRTRPDTGEIPGREQTDVLARDHDIVPLYRVLPVGELCPVTAFERLCPAALDEPGFLLENATAEGGAGRWSYVGHRPTTAATDADPLAAPRRATAESVAPVPGLPPFYGGAVGYLGYEAARRFEALPVAAGADPGLPESVFLIAEDLVVFDHVAHDLRLITLHRPVEETYDAAIQRLDAMQAQLSVGTAPAAAPAPVPREAAPPLGPAGWRAGLTRDEFIDRVERARAYITAGDAFQVVVSQRFSRPVRLTPIELYRQLRAVNPSPYMFLLSLGGERHVVGASPELLVRTQGRRVETRPLAGSRPRGADIVIDRALEVELLADEKERAEHVMLVDLGRNDIGRIAAPGSVQVDVLMDVERFSHVMHLSSTVSGELAPGRTGLDALRSVFPAGTLSGAPKIRAMEIIAELEPERRGVYGGALGSVVCAGQVDMAIVLRTLVIADGRVYVQAGAGVVAASDPSTEHAETLHKAAELFLAVERAEQAG